ncbi:hypothetical protein GCM10010269_64470 [Streptomyces humidus]|uniref:Uncharacterized protein n=1 Tax=Streptomyces humidus TaxID=52259 RepID=A0A918G3G9_9ACTN|nr:hypothetical protein GCM10010269_64470 [Streptomyces humidus]
MQVEELTTCGPTRGAPGAPQPLPAYGIVVAGTVVNCVRPRRQLGHVPHRARRTASLVTEAANQGIERPGRLPATASPRERPGPGHPMTGWPGPGGERRLSRRP